MMNIRHILLASLFIAQSANSEPASISQSVQLLENDWAHALNTGDLQAISQFYDEQASLTVPGAAPFEGRHAVLEALSGLSKDSMDMTLKTTAVLKLSSDYLVESGVAQNKSRAKGGEATMVSNYQVVWHRDGKGRWLIVRDTVSPR